MSKELSTMSPNRRGGLHRASRNRGRGRFALAAGTLAMVGAAFSALPAAALVPSDFAPAQVVAAGVKVHAARGPAALVGQTLLPGRALRSGQNRLLLTLSGDLELFVKGTEVWSSDTAGHHRARATMQPDGNFVLRTRSGTAFWSTHTAGHHGARLLLSRAGMLKVEGRSGRILWSETKPKPKPEATSVTGFAIAEMARFGWSSDQFSCLQPLWQRESGWNYRAENPYSGAYGIPQALPGSKMASAGSDWQTNPQTQIKWGLDYIKSRYGTPCGAWGHSQSTGWY